MVMGREKIVRCDSCGSENVEFRGKMEDEQYGFDTEGRTYLGVEIKKDYRCKDCDKKFQVIEIKKD